MNLPAWIPVTIAAAVFHVWRTALQALQARLRESLSALGSAGWFAGFAMTHVALVRGLGQIEILLTFLVGHFFLRERIRRGEALALVLVALGVVMIAAADMR